MTWARVVRAGVGLVGAVVLLGGLAGLAYGEPFAGLWGLAVGGVLLAVAVFEVGRYRSGPSEPDRPASLQRTDEVFVDPSSGQRTRVWFDPTTGERRYEPEALGAPRI